MMDRDDEDISGHGEGEIRIAKLLKSSVQIHEINQLEIVLSYGIKAKDAQKRLVRPHSYQVDAFFVFPQQTRITRESYSIDEFYHDIRSFIRFREPKLSFKEILGVGRKAHRSPLLTIERYIRQMKAGEIAEAPDSMIEEARIFGCSYFSYFQRRMDRSETSFREILERIQRGRDVPWEELRSVLSDAEENLEKSYQVLKTWRQIVGLTSDFPKDFLVSLKEEIGKVNEYCSYIFRAGLLRLATSLETFGARIDCEEQRRLLQRLAVYVRLERWYSKRMNFYWIGETSSMQEREGFLYRRGFLKRRIWSSLYLNSRTKPLFSVQKQIGAMIAAGLAGFWAIFFTLMLGQNLIQNSGEFVFGFSGVMLITMATLSYVLKDRIKELGRGYFKGLLGRVPDSSNRIFFKSHFEHAPLVPVGTIQEKASYRPFDGLPSDLKNLIRKFSGDSSTEYLSNKSIIHYRKRFEVEKDADQSLGHKIKALHDVIRLYVDNYLSPLDSRVQEVMIFGDDGSVKNIPATKVYFLDLILRKTVKLKEPDDCKTVLEYHRVVLSKRGIERIEPLL